MTIWQATDDGHADLSSHDSFTAGAPHHTFDRLRREDPLAWCEFPGAKGFWSVTRHADILALKRDFTTLSSAHGIRLEDQDEEEVLARRTFQETDPPEHTRTRLLVAKAFSKPMVAMFETQIRALCHEILDRALAQDAFCAVKDVARQLPMRMLGRIIGTPDEDLDWLVSKGDALIANTDADFTSHVLDQANTEAFRLMPFRSPAGAELYDYAQRLMDGKRERGDNSGVLHLIAQPDEALIWDTAADEFIPWALPAMYFRRTAMRAFELHGKQVQAGEHAFLPKPLLAQGGRGVHVNFSLRHRAGAQAGHNAISGGHDPAAMNALTRQCVAGLLQHHGAIAGLAAPCVNSYERLKPASLSGFWQNGGVDHRNVTVRVSAEGGASARLEHRMGDGAANPYTLVATVLQAARLGVQHGYPLQAMETGDGLTGQDATASVATSLGGALDALEADAALVQAVGADLVANHVFMKRNEVEKTAELDALGARDFYIRQI